MMIFKKFAAPVAAVLVMMMSPIASADGGLVGMMDGGAEDVEGGYPNNPLEPMIEVGAGGETQGNGMNLLLQVNVGARRVVEEGDPDDLLIISEQQVWANLQGEVSFNVSGDGRTVLPYMDMRFIPFSDTVTVGNSEDNLMLEGTLELFPIEIRRNVNIDQNLVVQVSVLGVQFKKDLVRYEDVPVLGDVTLYAQLAADAIGYKMAMHVSDEAGAFHGFHLIGLGGAVGANMQMSDNFSVKVEFGASADINFGGIAGPGGFSIQSDMAAYAAIKLNIARFVELFVRGQYSAACEAWGNGCQGAPGLMFGATFYF